jgi:hypothetical protein
MRNHSLLRSMLDRHARLGITERDVIINYLPSSTSSATSTGRSAP